MKGKRTKAIAQVDLLARYANEIRALAKRTVDDIVKIGGLLTKAKKLVRGEWLSWLEREFGWSADTAQNFIHLHAFSHKRGFRKFRNLPTSALYLLARKGVSDETRNAVFASIDAGEKVTVNKVRLKVSEQKIRIPSVGYVSEAPAKTVVATPVRVESEATRQAKAVLTLIRELAEHIADCRADDVAKHLSGAERGNFIDAIDEVREFITVMRKALGARAASANLSKMPTHDADPSNTKH